MSQNLDLNIEIIAKRCNNYDFPAGHITTSTVVDCTTLSCILSGGEPFGGARQNYAAENYSS